MLAVLTTCSGRPRSSAVSPTPLESLFSLLTALVRVCAQVSTIRIGMSRLVRLLYGLSRLVMGHIRHKS